MDKKVILLTGGSSGIGFETAKRLAGMGHIVYAAARRQLEVNLFGLARLTQLVLPSRRSPTP